MKALRFVIAICVVVMPALVSAQSTQRLTASKANEYGLIYTLPKTGIAITIEAQKTVKTPGEFYQYAKKYLNMTPILEPSVQWELTGAEIGRYAIADEDEQYLTRFKSGQGVFMMVTGESFPVSIGDAGYRPEPSPVSTLRAVAAPPTILDSPVAQQAVTEDMLRAQSTAKRAEMAAAKIYELRQQRNDILSGQVDNMPSDGAAMKLVLDNLSLQEQALTAMFVGTTSVSTDVKRFNYIPEDTDEDVTRAVVARLSVIDGIVEADDLSGEPIYVTVKVTHRGELPVNEKGIVKTFPKEGVAYRIPGTADVSVGYGGRQMAAVSIQVAQYGVVFGLDPGLFTAKKSPAYLHFDPETGAVLELGEISAGE